MSVPHTQAGDLGTSNPNQGHTRPVFGDNLGSTETPRGAAPWHTPTRFVRTLPTVIPSGVRYFTPTPTSQCDHRISPPVQTNRKVSPLSSLQSVCVRHTLCRSSGASERHPNFAEELTRMPAFAPIQDDETRMSTCILQRPPPVLQSELDAYLTYRTATFAARRQGGAVQSISAEADPAAAPCATLLCDRSIRDGSILINAPRIL